MQNFIQFQAWAETNVNFLYRVRAPLVYRIGDWLSLVYIFKWWPFVDFGLVYIYKAELAGFGQPVVVNSCALVSVVAHESLVNRRDVG